MPAMPLDHFGQLLMTNLRDRGIACAEGLIAGQWTAPDLQDLQTALAQLPPEQTASVKACVVRSLDSAIHDFLFTLSASRRRA